MGAINRSFIVANCVVLICIVFLKTIKCAYLMDMYCILKRTSQIKIISGMESGNIYVTWDYHKL